MAEFEAKDSQISPYRHAETSKACPELAVALSVVEGDIDEMSQRQSRRRGTATFLKIFRRFPQCLRKPPCRRQGFLLTVKRICPIYAEPIQDNQSSLESRIPMSDWVEV